jgi:hypothetical protein
MLKFAFFSRRFGDFGAFMPSAGIPPFHRT